MASKTITVNAPDGSKFDCYVSAPTGEAPAVLVIQEIFGVNQGLRQTADWLADNGFLAVAPDLFYRQEPGVQLTDQTDEEWQKAFRLYAGFDENLGAEDLKSCLTATRKLPECTGKVGTLGFCLGGKLAYLMSVRSNAECNVSYYGVGIEKNLAETANLNGHLLLHIAEDDQYVPPSAQKEIQTALGKNPKATIYVYQGQDHAFGRVGGAHYNRDAAELANARSLEFLRKHLQ
ncbi:MAG: dienelactone hydrolase family protein [Candidatus Obscuribacterales bacterium]